MSKKRKDKDTEKQPKLASRHYEMSSFSEKKVTRFIKEDATSLVEYNRRQLSRIYPAVALNYQTSTLPMQLNQGLFQDNGGCGYVLKPDILTEGVGRKSSAVSQRGQHQAGPGVVGAGLSVTWNEVVAFKVHVPQLALVSFLVKDSADNLLAQYTLPMRCMTEGYRVVPLQSKSSEALSFASLLVHVELKGS
ncbi:hypothetical protein NP493_305g01016 [Ridgeia piscesae]|uniref:phosphoinositide phospholipase C n=1 Tax=Ridgeia piscesae TaxID=27915 RepID=A0AAD9L7D9_RIDPI|nr:hypothetical protein NP493_305g01016 [Ridgeia piscesae]